MWLGLRYRFRSAACRHKFTSTLTGGGPPGLALMLAGRAPITSIEVTVPSCDARRGTFFWRVVFTAL